MDKVQDLLACYPHTDAPRNVADPWRASELKIREGAEGVFVDGLSTHVAGAQSTVPLDAIVAVGSHDHRQSVGVVRVICD
jgi:hypothetical protein